MACNFTGFFALAEIKINLAFLIIDHYIPLETPCIFRNFF